MHATDCEVMLAKKNMMSTVKTICNGFLLPRRNLSGTHTQVFYAKDNKKSYRLLFCEEYFVLLHVVEGRKSAAVRNG